MDKNKMKSEAIRRLKAIDYFSESLKQFRDYGKVMINEPPFGAHFFADDDAELKAEIEKFESESKHLVYAVVRSHTSFGMMDSLLFVESNDEDWKLFDVDLAAGYMFSYTINYDDPFCSEFGSIGVKVGPAGGLLRIA